MNASELIELASASPSRVSALSGVSRMTINRIKDKQVTPNFSTLRELALALGVDVELSVVPASDGDVAVAARKLLAQDHPNTDIRPEVQNWLERLQRHNFTEPRELARWAGHMSAAQHRKEAKFYNARTGLSQERLAKVLASAAGSYSYTISGGSAAAMWAGEAQITATILWLDSSPNDQSKIENVNERIAQTLTPARDFQPAGVIVAEAPSELFYDSHTAENIKYASPLQTVIDLYGLKADRIAFKVSADW